MRTKIITTALALAASLPFAFSQSTSSPVDIGLQQYHSYHGGDIDQVDLDNGNLTVVIPIVSYPQRGTSLKMEFGISYNGTAETYQQIYCVQGKCQYGWLPSSAPYTNMALTPGAPGGSPALYDMQDMTTSETKLSLVGTSPQAYFMQLFWHTPDGAAHGSGQTSTGQIALDGSGFQAGWTGTASPAPTITCTWDCSLPSIVPSPFLLGTRDGITYMQSSSGLTGGRARMDADGNYIIQNTSGFTDTVGRSIPDPVVNSTVSSLCPSGSYQSATWAPPGFSQSFTFCYANVPYETAVLETNGTIKQTSTTTGRLQSIILPNGQSWQFQYNESLTNCPPASPTDLADLSQITFPTGGTISYTYTCLAPYGTYYPYQATAVTSRTVNANDGTGNHTWTYSYSGAVTTVTDPLGNQTVHTINSASYATPNRVEQHFSGTQASGTLLRTVTTLYGYASANGLGLFPSSVTTTLENGQSTQTAYQVCCNISFAQEDTGTKTYPTSASNGKVTDAKVYDYSTSGLGTLLKETATAYLFQSNSNYLNPGFFDLVSTKTIYNGSGTEMAQTTYSYDQTARVTSGIVGMTGAQLTTPIYSGVWGHETTQSTWLNTGPSNPTTTVSYYDTGEPYQSTDPLGHTASAYFCTGSSPTTLPCTASTYLGALPTVEANALNQQSSFTYRTDTGQKLTITDPNNLTTTNAYNDPLNRLTSVTYPDGGLTSIQYNDTESIGATVTQKITASLNKQTQMIVDGLGRLSETILLSDPSGATYTLTTYDALGRKYQEWNPTRCTPTTTPCSGETTWGITTHQYDALNRETLLIPPDGTATSDNQPTSYSGNTTTAKDEAGNYRVSTQDALGRLTQISEGSVGYITEYTYDALSDLTCAEQHGGVTGTGCSSPSGDDASSPWRVRRFTYDSLGRLLTAKNPETGTITYGYNLNSILTSKTDNRGITITYNPDALNRITSKTYSDSEPTISYTYDGTTANSCDVGQKNYGIGRMTGMTDASGSAAWTFDTMGREWSETKTIASITKTTCSLYNYDGSASQVTYPAESTAQNAPQVVLSITPQGAGETLSVTDTTNNINYAKNLVYAPTGQLSTALYGYSSGYAGIAQTNTYNSRGQPIELKACGLASCTDGAGSQTPYVVDLSYNYGMGTNDNGNVQGITNNKNTARNQSFLYDGLNRLTQAVSGTSWGNTYTYDPWGNLYQTGSVSGTTWNAMTVSQQITGTNRFQLSGYVYDAAGNVLADGINSGCGTYAYSWNAEEQMSCAAGSTYTYDGEGARVEKNGGNSTPTLYWGGMVESNLSGTVTSEYIFVGGRRVGRRDVSTGSVYYYFEDMLGSSSVVATSAGAVENESDFYPFGGESVITQNLSNQKFKFTGKERDTESGLDDFGARYYNSGMGRFQSPDWASKAEPVPYSKLGNPQTLNLYTYVTNNPESAPDLDGHEAMSLEQYHAALWHTDHPNQLAEDEAVADKAADDFYQKESENQHQQQSNHVEAQQMQAQQQFPPANLTVNNSYVLVVENDSGHVNQDDVRDVEYDLHNAPDANHPNGTSLGPDVKSTEISEHLSNKKDFTESSSRITGQFEDNIGPHGKGKIAGATGSVSTDRYFTVTVNGKQIGAVRVLDRFGTHLVDHITVDFTNDRTILNGQRGPTDVP